MRSNDNSANSMRIVIDVREVCWKLFEQWKCIIIFAVIIMLLFLRFQYVRSFAAAQAAYENAKKMSETEEIDTLSTLNENEQGAVASVISMEKTIENLKNYIQNSYIMQINPYKSKQLHIEWNIQAEESVRNSLTQIYALEMRRNEICAAVSDVMNGVVASDQVSELIFVDTNANTNTALQEGVLSCDFLIDNETDTNELFDKITQAMQEIGKELTQKIGEHQLQLLTNEVRPITSTDILQKQAYVYSSLYTFNQSTINMKSNFTPNQNAVYNQLTKADDGKTDVEIAEPVKPKFFLKNFMIIGLAAGVCLYVLAYVLYIIAFRRIYAGNVLDSNARWRQFGTWYDNNQNSVLSWLIRDPFICRIHFKDEMNEAKQIENVGNAITSICRLKKCSNILMISDIALSENKNKFCSNIVQMLLDNDIHAKVFASNDYNAKSIRDEEICDCNGTVLIIDGNKSYVKGFENISLLCDYYDIPVLGSVFLR